MSQDPLLRDGRRDVTISREEDMAEGGLLWWEGIIGGDLYEYEVRGV